VHREDDFSKPLIFCDLEFMKVIIEDECDIGVGAIILPGVKIGEGSIIGAGSVVNKDVEPYCVVAGVPAKVLRRRSK
jgi:acetyltransferase-like isoleucine patch superfamily enzyme